MPVLGAEVADVGRTPTVTDQPPAPSGCARTGLLLAPDVQVDGPLLGVTLPRRPTPPVRPGCGYRVDPGDSSSSRWRCPSDHCVWGRSPM